MAKSDSVGRRRFLQATGSTSLLSAFPETALAFQNKGAKVVEEVAPPGMDPNAKPKYSIKFGVIGTDHNHIFGITAALKRGGGELVSVYGTNPELFARFQRRFGPVKVARSEDEILSDPSIQLVAAAPIPDLRAPLGIRAMRHGKDYLSDKPGITTLEQLAEVRQAIQETKRMFAIMFSEHLEVRAAVKAGELVKAGAIGQVVQTINIAPHEVHNGHRPDWFWDSDRFGGILCDVGSHQADQFVFYTGSTKAEVVASQVANVKYSEKPKFQDFGDMMVLGDRGTGYIRVDWYSPDGLGTWGDGRLFILGTDGYIELRKYIDIAGRKGGNHLFLADGKQIRYIDCSKVVLPFGPQFVGDIVNRTHEGQDEHQILLATELVLKAQKNAKRLHFSTR
jgi:predicted dehydrogenase